MMDHVHMEAVANGRRNEVLHEIVCLLAVGSDRDEAEPLHYPEAVALYRKDLRSSETGARSAPTSAPLPEGMSASGYAEATPPWHIPVLNSSHTHAAIGFCPRTCNSETTPAPPCVVHKKAVR